MPLEKTSQLFRVEVEGKPVPVPRGTDICSLGVGFFCGRLGPGQLDIGGLRAVGGVGESTRHVSRQVAERKVVTVTYLGGHEPPPPLDPARMMEKLTKMQEDYERDFGPTATTIE